MKRFILKTVLQNRYSSITNVKNTLFVKGDKSYQIDLNDPSLKVEYVTYDVMTENTEMKTTHFLDIVKFSCLSSFQKKILDFIVLFSSFSIKRIDRHKTIVTINKKTFTFTENYVFYGHSKVSLTDSRYLVIISEYLFDRPLTEIEHAKLKKGLPVDFVETLLKEQLPIIFNDDLYKAPSWISTIEELIIFKLFIRTPYAQALKFLKVKDCYPAPFNTNINRHFIWEINNYTSITYDELAASMNEIVKHPLFIAARQKIATYIEQNEYTFPERVQMYLQKERERVQMNLQKERDHEEALLENERFNERRLQEQQQLIEEHKQLLYQNEYLYYEQCVQLVEQAPYAEYIFEYKTNANWLRISNGKPLSFEIKNPSFEQPITDVKDHYRCLLDGEYTAVINNHEIFMRIFAGQDVKAFVLPQKDPLITNQRESLKLLVQTIENRERQLQVFTEYEQENANALANYYAQLRQEVREPFHTTAYIFRKNTREDYFSFNTAITFIQVLKNSTGEIEVYLDDGLFLGTINNNRLDMALEEGITLYGFITHADIQYSSNVQVYITNDYNLFEQKVQKIEESRYQKFCKTEEMLSIVGMKYHKGKNKLITGQYCTLRPEPNNAHDSFAVAVDNQYSEQVGYIARAEAVEIAMILYYHQNNPKKFYTFTITQMTSYSNVCHGKFELIEGNCC